MTAIADRAGPRTAGATFSVRKRTMTPGDTLIAWGLAIFVSEVTGRSVIIENTPFTYNIISRLTPERIVERCEEFRPSYRATLRWLSRKSRKKLPPDDSLEHIDWDVLRADYERWREHRQEPDRTGDAPAFTTASWEVNRFWQYQSLTNPYPQWNGYNTFVEQARVLWTPEGAAQLLSVYLTGDEDPDEFDVRLDQAMKDAGLTKAGERRRNPPGFLFPGLNKGPTMRLNRGGVTIGQASNQDWEMADRGDLSTFELYLAYIGYFNAARVQSYSGGRVVLVPAPDRARTPRILELLDAVNLRSFPDSTATAASYASLAYADAALNYVSDIAPDQIREGKQPLALTGVELGAFWMPSGNTYAPDQVSFIPLPAWLLPLRESEGNEVVREAVRDHQRKICPVGYAESDEAFAAAEAYRYSLSGNVLDWLKMIPVWQRAAMAEKFVANWRIEEIERITVAQQPGLAEIIHDPAFESVTSAMRRVTIGAHYAREARRAGQAGAEILPDRPNSRLSPQYDLAGTLQEAADRHRDEFLKELCDFAAEYNDMAMRNKQRLIRKEDLEQVIGWVNDDRRGLIPALIIAFGVSPRRRDERVNEATQPTDSQSRIETNA